MKLRVFFISIAACFIMLAVYSAVEEPGSAYKETRQVVLLRKLAHELMLSSGDSVSRVLPVKQISAEEFQVFPENPLAIVPDSFVNIVNRAIRAGNLTGSFTANIIKYKQKEAVYAFAASPFAKDSMVTCLGTVLPKDRYYLSFVFSPNGESNFHIALYCLSAAALVLAAFFFFKKMKKNEIIRQISNTQNEESSKEGLLQIGNYVFNPYQQWLELNNEKTTLTAKESKLLQIFANAPNAIIERDTLQKEVWENEGVIVTRSLDMFISKLRKKLSSDPGIKIVNVHGKGYRLEVNG